MRFPWSLYENDDKWIPPLNIELLGNRLFRVTGLLKDRHPFHRHAEVVYFLAKREEKIIGRITGIINRNHIVFHNEKVGFFGFYESIDDAEIAKVLLDCVRDWLKERGMKIMRGPANFSSNEPWGLLVENFHDYPIIGTPFNKRYYENLFVHYGMKKAMDLLGFMLPVMDKTEELRERRTMLKQISEMIKEKERFVIRPIRLGKAFKHELRYIKSIYDHAWGKNWGFVPMSDDEFEETAMAFRMLTRPKLSLLAFADDEPVGFVVVILDLNESIRIKRSIFGNSDMVRLLRFLKNRKKQKRTRLALLGIVEKYRGEGLGVIMFEELFKAGQMAGIEECELSWILENNIAVIRHSEAMNAKEYRRWRLYDYLI